MLSKSRCREQTNRPQRKRRDKNTKLQKRITCCSKEENFHKLPFLKHFLVWLENLLSIYLLIHRSMTWWFSSTFETLISFLCICEFKTCLSNKRQENYFSTLLFWCSCCDYFHLWLWKWNYFWGGLFRQLQFILLLSIILRWCQIAPSLSSLRMDEDVHASVCGFLKIHQPKAEAISINLSSFPPHLNPPSSSFTSTIFLVVAWECVCCVCLWQQDK
jgi:hypothetical protein